MSNVSKTASSGNRSSRIPTFATVEDEAAFWDTHDITEFEDELEPVDDVVFGSIRTPHGLLVRLDGEVLERLDRLAESQGVDSTSVVKRLIEEGVRHATAQDPSLGADPPRFPNRR